MLQLERYEQQIGYDQESEQPSSDGRRPVHEERKGMMPARASFLESREPEQKNYQQRDRAEEFRTDECRGHHRKSYPQSRASAPCGAAFGAARNLLPPEAETLD